MFSSSHFHMPHPFTGKQGVSAQWVSAELCELSIGLCLPHWSMFFFSPSKAKQDELEDLNKELRQCNLQQFIQQTGVLPAHTHSRTELQEQLEQLELAHLLQVGYRNGGMETQFNMVHSAVQVRGLALSSYFCFSIRPQCNSTGLTAAPHCQTVPGTSTQPAKPSGVQSQPWGCVCVRPCCFPSPSCSAPLLPIPWSQSPLPLVPSDPAWLGLRLQLPVFFLVLGRGSICVVWIPATCQQLPCARPLKAERLLLLLIPFLFSLFSDHLTHSSFHFFKYSCFNSVGLSILSCCLFSPPSSSLTVCFWTDSSFFLVLLLIRLGTCSQYPPL